MLSLVLELLSSLCEFLFNNFVRFGYLLGSKFHCVPAGSHSPLLVRRGRKVTARPARHHGRSSSLATSAGFPLSTLGFSGVRDGKGRAWRGDQEGAAAAAVPGWAGVLLAGVGEGLQGAPDPFSLLVPSGSHCPTCPCLRGGWCLIPTSLRHRRTWAGSWHHRENA